MGLFGFSQKETRAQSVTQQHRRCCSVSFVLYISGAKFEEHCSFISGDSFDSVLNCLSGISYDVMTFLICIMQKLEYP